MVPKLHFVRNVLSAILPRTRFNDSLLVHGDHRLCFLGILGNLAWSVGNRGTLCVYFSGI